MNKLTRTLCLVAAGLIAFGLALAGFTYLLGANTNIPIGPWDRYYNGSGGDGQYDSANMIVNDEVLEAFDSIDMDVAYQEVEIREGDDFSIYCAFNQKYSNISYRIENGKLLITETTKKRYGGFNWNILGAERRSGDIIVTYPKGTVLKDVKMDSDLGTITVENMNAEELSIDADMGAVELANVHVSSLDISAAMGSVTIEDSSCDTAVLSCDMGSIDVDNFVSRNGFEADASAGSLDLSGDFRGKTYIDCDMGDVSMELQGTQAQYSYDLEVDLGSIEIDGDSMGNHTKSSAGADYLEISSSMGDISIEFNN